MPRLMLSKAVTGQTRPKKKLLGMKKELVMDELHFS